MNYSTSGNTALDWLHGALNLKKEDSPFPWQQELLRRFLAGKIERSLDIPTGLGKTAVMAIWLIARAFNTKIPRRLVYIVDRRAVVDQATEVAIFLREYVDQSSKLKQALNLGRHALPISTLRGKHVDNKEWLEDPALPGIIIGTVDMIGSRLLFSGYGVSRKMRPYHAGLLGADTLMVLDEAHLIPPFEKLLESIATKTSDFGPHDDSLRALVPPFKLLTLSATGRNHAIDTFGLTKADFKAGTVTRKRLDSKKRLTLHCLEDQKQMADKLAQHAWELCCGGTVAFRIIVFCNERKVAYATKEAVDKFAKGDKKHGIAALEVNTQLFVGGRRIWERENTAKWLKDHGFMSGHKADCMRPSFLFATSAGEVGVDLDADHMVCDLVTWERMIQRLGRVNRLGEGDADVIVLVKPDPTPSKTTQKAIDKQPNQRDKKEAKAVEKHETAIQQIHLLQGPIARLPIINGIKYAGPSVILDLKHRAVKDEKLQAIIDAAMNSEPIYPALTRPLVDAWSMTTLKEHTGRPQVEPWLRGWREDDKAQTVMAWRTHMPICLDGTPASTKQIEAFFEAAPPHTSELLETETHQVVEWLEQRAIAIRKMISASRTDTSTGTANQANLEMDSIVAIVLNKAGDLQKTLKISDLIFDSDDKKANRKGKDSLNRLFAGSIIIVDSRLAGLKDGLLNGKINDSPRTIDDGHEWLPVISGEPSVRFRVRAADTDTLQASDGLRCWRSRYRLALDSHEDSQPARWLVVEKWRHDATTEEDRSAGHPQLLNTHLDWAKQRALEIGKDLNLPDDYQTMLVWAACLHDQGKRSQRWQRAFNAPSDGVYAKTMGPLNIALLDAYRHEFMSVSAAEKNENIKELPPDLQDLALHLIASHHGFARPIIAITGCEDTPPSLLEKQAQDVALRFARLQQRWGPWGLAWWESLLRAADQQASRDNERTATPSMKEDK